MEYMSQGTTDMISTAGGVDTGTAAAGLETLRAELEPLEPLQRLQCCLLYTSDAADE